MSDTEIMRIHYELIVRLMTHTQLLLIVIDLFNGPKTNPLFILFIGDVPSIHMYNCPSY